MVNERAKRNHNVEILNSIYKNTKMASESIQDILHRCNDDKLRKNLVVQKERYDNTCMFAGTELSKFGEQPKNPPKINPMITDTGYFKHSKENSYPSNLAKTVIEDTTIGIIDLARTVNRSTAADQKIIDQARNLIQTEQDYSNQLKSFL